MESEKEFRYYRRLRKSDGFIISYAMSRGDGSITLVEPTGVNIYPEEVVDDKLVDTEDCSEFEFFGMVRMTLLTCVPTFEVS